MKKKVIIGVSAVLVAVIAGLVIWRVTAKKTASSGEEAVLYADSVGMLTGTGLGTQNRFAGIVESQSTLNIQLESGQTVKDIFVEKGEAVEIGTPLFQYDTEEIGMKLEQANLELEGISNSIDTKNAQIDELVKEKKKASSSEQLSYTTQIQEMELAVKQEEYNYKVKQLEIERLQKSLDSSQVTSTIAGVVQEINETPGYDNYTGEPKPFMSILAVGKYRIKGSISEQNMGNLYAGMPVIVHSRVDETITWTGTVDSIDTEKPISDQNGYISSSDSSMSASKYPFYVTLDSSDGLMLGQHVYLEPDMGLGEEKEGMWLMSSYILDADSDPYVWAAGSDDKLEKRSVALGAYDEESDTYEITDGLSPADYIVWPSEDCKKGVDVMKNDGSMLPPVGGGEMPLDENGEMPADGGEEILPDEGGEMPADGGADMPIEEEVQAR